MADTIMAPKDVFRIALDHSMPTDDFVLGLFPTTRPEKFGMVNLGPENKVLRIDDKPKATHLIYMWGFIIWRPAFTEHLNDCVSAEAATDFAQIMNSGIQRGLCCRGVILEDGSYSDMGTYDRDSRTGTVASCRMIFAVDRHMPECNTHDEMPRVTFVILNWNQGDMTLDCLKSLKAMEYANYDVIVVDNASSDDSVAKIHQAFPACEILANQDNLGYSEGNNVGIRRVLERDLEFIFLLNNDTYIHPKMLTKLVMAAQNDASIGIAGPTMFYANPPDMLWGGKNWVDWKKIQVVRERMGDIVDITSLENQPPIEVMYIDFCAILVKSQVFRDIGLLDNRFFINFDDVDFCVRARKAGYIIKYVPSAFIWHRVSAAMGIGSPATTYYMTRNSLLLFARHAPGVWKLIGLMKILFRAGRTVGAWSIKTQYRTDTYRRKRIANIYAVRDFFLGRFGQMGLDVYNICYRI